MTSLPRNPARGVTSPLGFWQSNLNLNSARPFLQTSVPILEKIPHPIRLGNEIQTLIGQISVGVHFSLPTYTLSSSKFSKSQIWREIEACHPKHPKSSQSMIFISYVVKRFQGFAWFILRPLNAQVALRNA